MLIIHDLILAGGHPEIVFLITGWCYTEIRWICVRIGAHAFEVGHFWPTDSEEPWKRRNKEFKDLKN